MKLKRGVSFLGERKYLSGAYKTILLRGFFYYFKITLLLFFSTNSYDFLGCCCFLCSKGTTAEYQKPNTPSPPPSHNSRTSISGKSSLSSLGIRRSRTHHFLHTARCLKLLNGFTYLSYLCVMRLYLLSSPFFFSGCSKLDIAIRVRNF